MSKEEVDTNEGLSVMVFSPANPHYDMVDASGSRRGRKALPTAMYDTVMREFNLAEVGAILVFKVPGDKPPMLSNLNKVIETRGLEWGVDYELTWLETDELGRAYPKEKRPLRMKKLLNTRALMSSEALSYKEVQKRKLRK